MRVLFSAIGNTDPIKGYHDGAMLHISRVYKPDYVYLFFSKDMCGIERKDYRFTKCIEFLGKKIGKTISVDTIERENLVDVHVFDAIIAEFQETVRDIFEKHPNDEILLNISSGTPAMKAALQTIATMSSRRVIPIQVSTPDKDYIEKRETTTGPEYVESMWELNEDNEENFKDRTSVSSYVNMAAKIKKEIIKSEVQGYNYVSALEIAKNMRDFVDDRAVLLIEGGAARMKLDKVRCLQIQTKTNYTMFTHTNSEDFDIFEYLVLEKIKLEKEEYADFFRGLTPLFFCILEKIITDTLKFDIKKFYNESKRWIPEKVSSNRMVLSSYGKGEIRYSFVASRQLVSVIEALTDDAELKKKVRDFRDIEEKVRNPIAHSIKRVTGRDIIKESGKSPNELFDLLKQLTIYAGIKIKSEDMNTYDRLNEEICKYLE